MGRSIPNTPRLFEHFQLLLSWPWWIEDEATDFGQAFMQMRGVK